MTNSQQNGVDLEGMIREHDQASARLPFQYLPIDPSKKYDTNEFLFHYGTFEDLSEYKNALDNNINDPKNRGKLFGKLFGNPGLSEGVTPDLVAKTAKTALDSAEGRIIGYAEKNRDKLMKIIYAHEGAAIGFMQSVPLYSTDGKNKRHDEIVGLVAEVKKVEKLAKGDEKGNKDMNAIRKYLTDSVKKRDDIPKELKALYGSLLGGDRFALIMLGYEADFRKKAYELRMTSDGKTIDEEKARSLVRTSLDRAYERLDEIKARISQESDPNKINALQKELGDAWDKNIKPYYAVMAKLVFEIEKEEMKDKDFEEERDAELKKRLKDGMKK